MFRCDCCKFNTTFSSNYKRHLETKKHKERVEKEIKCKGSVTDSVTENTIIEVIKSNKSKDCPYCNKVYSCRQNLYEHKKICKFKEISETNSGDINNTINGNNNSTNIDQSKNIDNSIDNSIHNTVVINNYSETDLSKLTDKNYITACNGVNYSVNRLIEMTHYIIQKFQKI